MKVRELMRQMVGRRDERRLRAITRAGRLYALRRTEKNAAKVRGAKKKATRKKMAAASRKANRGK